MLRLTSLLALMLVAQTAFAVDVEKARAHFKSGLAAFTLGDYAKAALEYEAAYSEEPDPALLYNAAQAHRLAGNKTRALFLYQNYLRYFPGQGNEREVHRHIVNLQAAIESEQRAKDTPPMESKLPELKHAEPAPLPKSPEPRAAAPSEAALQQREAAPAAPAPAETKAALVVSEAPPPKKKTKAWVWGVVGGVAVVVVGVAVGLGVGLSGTSYPNADIGSGRLH